MNQPFEQQPKEAYVGRLLGRLRETVNLLDDVVLPTMREDTSEEAVEVADDANADEVQLVRRAAALYRLRRCRDRLLGGDLFGEGSWDMLLDLYVREATGKQTYVSSACVAAAIPATTALRHVRNLAVAGLIERHPDPLDGRRVYLRLTPVALERLRVILRHRSLPDEQ